MGVVSDSAFPVSNHLYTRIETPMKANDLEKLPIHLRAIGQAKSNAITSIRQAAEWGMGAAEKTISKTYASTSIRPKQTSFAY